MPVPYPEEFRRDELPVDGVERAAGHLFHEDPGDHVAGVGVREAVTGWEGRRAVGGRVVHQLDRTPHVARVLAQPGEEGLVVEVVGHGPDERG